MKKLFVCAFIVLSTICYSQTFEIKKVFTMDQLIKFKGSIIINDSLIVIKLGKQKTDFKIGKKSITGKFQRFKAIMPEGSDTEVRFTLNNDKVFKKMPWSLTMDTKDNFKGTVNTVVYYLKKEE